MRRLVLVVGFLVLVGLALWPLVERRRREGALEELLAVAARHAPAGFEPALEILADEEAWLDRLEATGGTALDLERVRATLADETDLPGRRHGRGLMSEGIVARIAEHARRAIPSSPDRGLEALAVGLDVAWVVNPPQLIGLLVRCEAEVHVLDRIDEGLTDGALEPARVRRALDERLARSLRRDLDHALRHELAQAVAVARLEVETAADQEDTHVTLSAMVHFLEGTSPAPGPRSPRIGQQISQYEAYRARWDEHRERIEALRARIAAD